MHSNVFVTTEWRERITGNFLVLFVCLLCFFFHFSSSLLRSFVRWFVRLHFLSLSFAIAVLLFVNTIYNIVSAWSTTVVGTHNICTCQCTHGVVFKLGVFIFLLLSCVWFRSFAFGYVVKLKHIILSQFHHVSKTVETEIRPYKATHTVDVHTILLAPAPLTSPAAARAMTIASSSGYDRTKCHS